MDKTNITKPAVPANGIYVAGVIVSHRARLFHRKDGSGISVLVEHEIATQPGVALWQRYLDPKKDAGLKVEGDNVLEYPNLKEFQPVTIKVTRLRTDQHSGQVLISAGEIIA